jgi:hypothetical protein
VANMARSVVLEAVRNLVSFPGEMSVMVVLVAMVYWGILMFLC